MLKWYAELGSCCILIFFAASIHSLLYYTTEGWLSRYFLDDVTCSICGEDVRRLLDFVAKGWETWESSDFLQVIKAFNKYLIFFL